MRYLMLTLILVAILSGASAQTRYSVVTPSDFTGADRQFTPGQLSWARPLIKTLGCIFSQNAIRHHLKPTPVSFEPCGAESEIKVTLDENLIEMTVIGVVMVNGSKRPFKVALQHYPPSTDENGFQITGLDIVRY